MLPRRNSLTAISSNASSAAPKNFVPSGRSRRKVPLAARGSLAKRRNLIQQSEGRAQSRHPPTGLIHLYFVSQNVCAFRRGEAVTRFRLSFILVFLPAVFFAGSLQAAPHSPPSTVPSEQRSASAATQSPASPSAPFQPKNKITAYTLPPDLYRKARNRGRIGFASRIIGFSTASWSSGSSCAANSPRNIAAGPKGSRATASFKR